MCFGGVALEGAQKGGGEVNGNNELSLTVVRGLQTLDFILSFSEYLHFNYALTYTESLNKFGKIFFL